MHRRGNCVQLGVEWPSAGSSFINGCVRIASALSRWAGTYRSMARTKSMHVADAKTSGRSTNRASIRGDHLGKASIRHLFFEQ